MSEDSISDELEDSVLEILEGPETDREVRLATLLEAHPDSAIAVREWLAAAAVGDEAGDAAGDEGAHVGQLSETFGRYEIERIIGRGGMGQVYLAEDPTLGRKVALKVLLRRHDPKTPEFRRFLREAQAVAAVTHPGVVSIHEIGELDGVPYFTMEHLTGQDLKGVLLRMIERCKSTDQLRPSVLGISGRDYPETRAGFVHAACALVASIAEALEDVHMAGVVHRDVKPENIMLRADGTPVLIDFGLARLVAASPLTDAGRFVGTLHYASPEQVSSRELPVDSRTDVYSLGVTLFELMALRLPFADQEVGELVRAIEGRATPRLRGIHKGLPKDVDTICQIATQKEAEDRYASAAAFAADLRRFLEGEPILARPTSTAARLRQWSRRNPGRTAAIVASLVLIASLFAVWRLVVALQS